MSAPGFTDSKPYRLALVLATSCLLSAWTCTAIVRFDSCFASQSQPIITSLSPGTIFANAAPILLVVNGSEFVPSSQILWNGKSLPTRFVDSGHLQATITQQTFENFGGSAGGSVMISVMSPPPNSVLGCTAGISGSVALFIN
jgi:hypothetical protein